MQIKKESQQKKKHTYDRYNGKVRSDKYVNPAGIMLANLNIYP